MADRWVAPDASSQPIRASLPPTSSATASCQSGSMPGGRGSAASDRAQPVRSACDGSSRATGPRKPPCARS